MNKRLLFVTFAFFIIPLGPSRAVNNATAKIVTYKVKNNNDNKDAKAYAVFVDVEPKNIDTTKSFGKILTSVRLEERKPLGTLIVFENDKAGIPRRGGTDDIQIYFKDLPKTKKDVRFSNVSTLRSEVGRDGPVIEDEVPRIGFKAEKDPEYYILNTVPLLDDPSDPAPPQGPFSVSGLEYLSNVDEISDTTALLDLGNSYGFSDLDVDPLLSGLQDFVSVPGLGGESPMINVPGPVDIEKWFYVRGLAHFEIDGAMVDVPFVHGQKEFHAPDGGSSLPLLLMAGAALAYCKIRGVRKSRS